MLGTKIYNLLFPIFIIFCLISFLGGIIYRFYRLNLITSLISLTLALAAYLIIQFLYKPNNKLAKTAALKTSRSFFNYLLVILYFILLAVGFFILWRSQTGEPIISPWQVVPSYFFIVYGLATIILIINILNNSNLSLLLIILHYFLSFAIAIFVYKIGYGFDPFIHQSTVALIDKIGSVVPKTNYYLGQYGLLVIFHKITAISLTWLDKLLVPALAAIYFPLILWRTLTVWFKNNQAIDLILLAVLILTFPFFIVTTPQNFAYLLLLLVILLGLICRNIYDLINIFIIALAALITQPIAGIPAILLAILLTAYHSDNKIFKKYFYIVSFILAIFILPISFYLFDKNTPVSINSNNFTEASANLPVLNNPSQDNFILNFIYLYGFNLKLIVMALTLAGFYIACRYRKNCQLFFLYGLMSLSLLFSFLISGVVSFNFLISYERDNYINRIILISTFFCLPFLLLALYSFLNKLLKQNGFIKLSFLIFIAILITASLYLSYPRFDNYFNSHGYSISASDLKAVNWIKADAKTDYIVLANQQVSAAALREFGFSHYYKKNIFYYPIPTGGTLYQYYLNMVYDTPSKDTMMAAMDLTGVKISYFVLNKYWWAFPKVLEEAKLEADSWQELADGDIYVFKYSE